MAFPIGNYDPNKTLHTPKVARLLSLCLPVNKPADSGADVSSVPEFANRRVAQESIVPNRICAGRHCCDSFYSSRDVPGAPHDTEVADEKLVPPVRRSASHAQAQLRDPGDDQPFDPRFDRRRPDTGGAGDTKQTAIGGQAVPNWLQASPEPVPRWSLSPRTQRYKLRLLFNEKAGPVSACAPGGPAWIFRSLNQIKQRQYQLRDGKAHAP